MNILMQLFAAFIQVGLFSVGGGYAAIPLIQDQIVNIHGLMTMSEFTDLITIVGTRLSGVGGAVICTLGCIIPSFIICLTLAHFYYKYRNFGGVQTVLAALRPAVVALIASAGLSILLLGLFGSETAISLHNIRPIEVMLFAGALFILRKYKASAISIIFGSGVVGTAAYAVMNMIA